MPTERGIFMSRVKKMFLDIRFITSLYLLAALVVSIQKIYSGALNNVLIFRYSFVNLINKVDLYSLHPEQHLDYYKYSPAFAIFMAPFAAIPSQVGAVVWNLLNAVIFLLGIKSLDIEKKYKTIFLWLCFFEYMTSMNYFQSNVMMAGLMMMVFSCLAKTRPVLSGFISTILFNIKIFGAGVASVFLLYSKKRWFIISAVLSSLVLAVVGILLSSFSYTYEMYLSWLKLLLWDFDASLGVSVMALINQYILMPKLWIQLAGTALTFSPIVICWFKGPRGVSRVALVSAIMIWSVIFNHKAETATYIIAVTGAVLWFVYSSKTILDKILIGLVFIFTTLSPTEFFPKVLVEILGGKDFVKLVPCVLLWIKILFDEWSILLSSKGHQSYR